MPVLKILRRTISTLIFQEEEINFNELLTEMKQTDDEIKKAQNEVLSSLKDLTSSDQDIMLSINCLVEMIEG